MGTEMAADDIYRFIFPLGERMSMMFMPADDDAS